MTSPAVPIGRHGSLAVGPYPASPANLGSFEGSTGQISRFSSSTRRQYLSGDDLTQSTRCTTSHVLEMSRPASRFVATVIDQVPRSQRYGARCAIRSFSGTRVRRADSERGPTQEPTAPSQSSPAAKPLKTTSFFNIAPRNTELPSSPSLSNFKSPTPMQKLTSALSSAPAKSTAQTTLDVLARATNAIQDTGEPQGKDWGEEPFHFHVYGHKHNTHITVTKPDRNAIINVSTGNIGFRKSKRGTYDAAYQLTAYVVDKLYQGNWHKEIKRMEVVLRGFGNGREAGVKVLLGNEGRLLRKSIVKVSDSTRLKFGGTRSPKPRRLG
jgi:small subunit ribosomal protein S11